MRTQRLLSAAIFVVTTLAGVTAFLYPFWSPLAAADTSGNLAHAEDATLMLTVLVTLSFLVLLLEVQNQAVSAKSIALLGVQDIIVVHTPEATLVMHASKAEELKQLHGMLDDDLR